MNIVEKIKSIYGDYYDLTETVYVNSKTPFLIKCKNCGIIKRDYNHFIIRKQGCKCFKAEIINSINYNGTNYQKDYDELISAAKSQNRTKGQIYYELHHIKPKSLGGDNSKENLVLLTFEEHLLAHYLLWKITKTDKMAKALISMKPNIPKEELEEIKKHCSNNSKKVYCLELDKEFNSCKEATIYLNEPINHSSYIGAVCNGKIKACFNWKGDLRFHWCWIDDKEKLISNKEKLLWEEEHKQELKNKNISKAKKMGH